MQPIGCRLSPQTWASLIAEQPHAQSGLPLNGLHLRSPCNYMDYYSFTDPEGTGG